MVHIVRFISNYDLEMACLFFFFTDLLTLLVIIVYMQLVQNI